MSLIDTSYFVGDIALPNLDQVENTFQVNMDTYEEEALRSLLGYQLYTAFIAGIAEVTPAQKWIDLRDGAEFTFEVNGITVTDKWEGLINVQKISFISYYVYAKYRDINKSSTTSIDEVQGLPENATNVNYTTKVMDAWNKGVDLYGETPLFSGFSKYSTTYEYFTDYPSAYNFLNANRADYDNWVFTPLMRNNNFGL